LLSYDVRGQGASGGQAAFLGRDDIADQAAVLKWWHKKVRPTKTAFYGLSQGGYLSWTAAVYNCGSARAASYDSTIPCDSGKRWIDAIAPMQGPTEYLDDGTCPLFGVEAIAYSRANPALITALIPCLTGGAPQVPEGIFVDVAHRMDRIDVPVYAVTSFYDRLVLPQLVTEAYEKLRARTLAAGDPYFGTDVRLTISNDSHGAVGGNFAVIGDVFDWIAGTIAGGSAPRAAKVAIAQEWAGNAFRLEQEWPIPSTSITTYYLSRGKIGKLSGAPGGVGPDELRNLPLPGGAPEAPFVGTIVNLNNDIGIKYARLLYRTPAMKQTMEVTGQALARIFVSSGNARGKGTGQLHLGLSEVTPDGSVLEFAHARIGLRDLGQTPMPVDLAFTIASHRINKGNRLMLSVASTDIGVVFPAQGIDPFFVHHDAGAPSSITIPVVPVDRVPPAGNPPSGAGFTEDPLGAICTALNLPC
jgi:predicted acyl esterase